MGSAVSAKARAHSAHPKRRRHIVFHSHFLRACRAPMQHGALFRQASSCHFLCAAGASAKKLSCLPCLHCRWCGLLCQAFLRILQSCPTRWICKTVRQLCIIRINWVGIAYACSREPGVHLGTKGGAFLESIRQYFKRTDKIYLLLCIFSSTMAVVALASWAAKQGSGFATDEITGAITGIGDYRRALVQAGSSRCLASSLRCCSPASTTAALSRCGRCM